MIKSLFTALLTLCLFLGTHFLSAQQSLFVAQTFVERSDTLRYRQLTPDYGSSVQYPLVIFLHGSGERGNDNFAQLKWGVHNFATDNSIKNFPAIVIAPQCPSGQTWANYTRNSDGSLDLAATPTKSMDLLRKLIDEMINKLPIDRNRIYITGLSMGGYGTFDALQRYSELFAAAVPVCGGGDLAGAKVFKEVPMWIFTGAEDQAVDPQLSFDMVDALQSAGAKPGFTQYPEVGHFSWIAAYSDPMMMAWLFRQRKK